MVKRLLLVFFLCFYCLSIFAEETVRKNLEETFNNINWAEDKSLYTEQPIVPYKIKESKDIVNFADYTVESAVFPYLDGIGILDYTGVDDSILNFLTKLQQSILLKNLNDGLFSKERTFLPYIFRYITQEFSNIKTVFFARPEVKSKEFSTTFRLNFENGEYGLLSVIVKFEDDKWVLNEFEIVGEQFE